MPSASNNRLKLINAAVDLFSLNGYDGVSIRDLCRAVGIKESSFYNHFHSKEELLALILEGFRTRYRNHLPAEEQLDALLAPGSPHEFWFAALHRFIEMMTDPGMRKINRILHLEQYRNPLARAILNEEIIQRPQRYAELAFEKFIARGWVRSNDPALLAQGYQLPLYALMSQYLALDAAGEDTAPLFRRMEEHVRFFNQLIAITP
jgi:AcrR family transcriptional regulator